MSASQPLTADDFQHFLQRCRQRFLLHKTVRGLALLLTLTVTVVLLSVGLDFLWPLPGSVRLGLLAGCFAVMALGSWYLVLQPLIVDIPDAELGAAVDLAYPEFHEAVATVVSVESPEATVGEAGSSLMRQRLWNQIGRQLVPESSTAIMAGHGTRHRCIVAICVLGLAAIPLVTWQSWSLLLLQRLFTPLTSLPTATNLYFSVQAPGNIAARGTDVTFRAVPQWRDLQDHPAPENVHVVLESESGQTDRIDLRYDSSAGDFEGTLHSVSDSITWRIQSGSTATADHYLRVVDGPQPTTAMLKAVPPDYTGLPARTFSGITGLMEIFSGSVVSIHLEFNKPIDAAEFAWVTETVADNDAADANRMLMDVASTEPEPEEPPNRAFVLSADGRTADLSFTATRDGLFQLNFRDEDNLTNDDVVHREVMLVIDQAPELSVQGVRAGDKLRPDDVIPIDCSVTDDIGIGDLELHLQFGEEEPEILPAQGDHRGLTQTSAGFRVRLSDRSLSDGDEVRLRVRVTDERQPDPHEVWSDDITLTIDSDARPLGSAAIGEETQQIIEQLEATRRQITTDADALRDLSATPQENWTDNDHQELTRLSERQQLVGGSLQQTAQRAAAHPLMKSPAETLDQVGQSLRRNMAERLTQQHTADASSVSQAEQDLNKTWRQLGEIIEDIREAGKLEQDLAELNRLALQAEQLALEAQDLRQDEQTPESDLPAGTDLQARSQQLREQAEHVEQTREELTSDLTDLLSEQPELQRAAQQALQQRQQDAASQARDLAERQQQLASLMEYEDAAAPEKTAQAQQQMAQEAAALEQDLSDIGQQVSLPGVGLADRSAAVEAARQSAESASEQTQQAGMSLQDGDRQGATAAAQEATAALDRVAQLEAQRSATRGQQQLVVPAEVGQSVTEALQNLAQASAATSDQQTSSDQTDEAVSSAEDAVASDAESGVSESAASPASDASETSADQDVSDATSPDGAPTGQESSSQSDAKGSSGRNRTQQLAQAAAALSDAAEASLPESAGGRMPQLPLPGNFSGNMPGERSSQQQGRASSAIAPAGTQRDWGQLHDELSHDILSGDQDAVDSRYSSMIRAYFRELARSSLEESSP